MTYEPVISDFGADGDGQAYIIAWSGLFGDGGYRCVQNDLLEGVTGVYDGMVDANTSSTSITPLAGNQVALAWRRDTTVHTRRIDATCLSDHPIMLVSSTPGTGYEVAHGQSVASAALSEHLYAVAWVSQETATGLYWIMMRTYSASSGVAQSDMYKVNLGSPERLKDLRLVSVPGPLGYADGALLTWSGGMSDGDVTSLARYVDSDGQVVGLPWQPYLEGEGPQSEPTPYFNHDGGLHIFWRQGTTFDVNHTVIMRQQ